MQFILALALLVLHIMDRTAFLSKPYSMCDWLPHWLDSYGEYSWSISQSIGSSVGRVLARYAVGNITESLQHSDIVM